MEECAFCGERIQPLIGGPDFDKAYHEERRARCLKCDAKLCHKCELYQNKIRSGGSRGLDCSDYRNYRSNKEARR